MKSLLKHRGVSSFNNSEASNFSFSVGTHHCFSRSGEDKEVTLPLEAKNTQCLNTIIVLGDVSTPFFHFILTSRHTRTECVHYRDLYVLVCTGPSMPTFRILWLLCPATGTSPNSILVTGTSGGQMINQKPASCYRPVCDHGMALSKCDLSLEHLTSRGGIS